VAVSKIGKADARLSRSEANPHPTISRTDGGSAPSAVVETRQATPEVATEFCGLQVTGKSWQAAGTSLPFAGIG